MTTLLLALLFWQTPEALSDRALERAQQKQFREAEELWTEALRQSPDFFPAAFNLGYMLFANGEPARAAPHLERAAKLRPKDFNTRYVLGAALSRTGQVDDALRHWRAAHALQPGNAKLMQLMAVEYGKGRYFREAAAVAERALAISPDAAAYLIAIKAHQDAGDHPAALRVAQRMLAAFPDNPRATFEYGYELYRAGRREEGLGLIRKAIDAGLEYEEPHYFYAEILAKDGRHAEAIPSLRRALELRPDYVAAWVALARALMSLGRNEEAKAELLRAVEKSPTHPQPHLLLSQLYLRLGDEQAAAREKELSLKLRREHPEAVEAPQSRPFTNTATRPSR